MPEKNAYELLGLTQRASADEIRKRYRLTALRSHPLRSGDGRLFDDVCRAYWHLGDAGRRADYDKSLKAGADWASAREKVATSPDVVFSVEFGMLWQTEGDGAFCATGSDDSVLLPTVLQWLRTAAVEPGRRQSIDLLAGGLFDWGLRELEWLESPVQSGYRRVVVVRHGMGRHNDMMGALSYGNRDAELNSVGVEQARRVGTVLQRAGVLTGADLVVVSPFRRTLQTAENLFGEHFRTRNCIVTPLAAEHTLARSFVQQGDRGSCPDELRKMFPAAKYPQLGDFRMVERYCEERSLDGGGWWKHNTGCSSETWEQFQRRAKRFREWLGQQCHSMGSNLCVVVSHGGILYEAFGGTPYCNAQFRVLDLAPDGNLSPDTPRQRHVDPSASKGARYVFDVTRERGPDSHYLYSVVLDIHGQQTLYVNRLSKIRSALHDVVKERLGPDYTRLQLDGKFPAVHWLTQLEQGLKAWLEQLFRVMGDPAFTPDLVAYIDEQFLEGYDPEDA